MKRSFELGIGAAALRLMTVLTLCLGAAALNAQTPSGWAKPRLFAYGFASGPDASAWLPVIADLDGDGYGDVVAVNMFEPGAVHVLSNIRGMKCAALGETARAEMPVTRIKTCRLDGGREGVLLESDGRPSRIFERKADGTFVVTDAAAAPASAPASAPTTQSASMPASAPSEAPTSRPALPADLPPSSIAIFGDLTGDKVDDLLVIRRDRERRRSADLLIYAGFDVRSTDRDQDGLSDAEELSRKTDPLDADTDKDGLSDAWEVRGEGVLDLPALGAKPGAKDVVVYVQRIGDVDGATAAAEVARAQKTWAELPVVNPDGSKGIHMIVLWLPPLSASAGAKPWWVNAEENMPRAAKGLAHYLQVAPGGGGQSGELADAGGCGANALWATFLHEFGHQVGLSHSGGDLPGMCPIYTSLMNYAYSYGFDGSYEKIHYSTGALKDIALNETRLDERMAVPFERLLFLAKGPFAFKLEKDGEGTKIDWNRNGVFEQAPVRADITDVYGADAGVRHTVAKTIVGAAIVAHRERLWIFSVDREKILEARYALHEEGRFSEPIRFPNIRPIGDLAAASDGTNVTLFVPTDDGIRAIRSLDVETMPAAKAHLCPETKGAGCSTFVLDGRAMLLLWDGVDRPIRVAEPIEFGYAAPVAFTDIRSVMTPGAVVDPKTKEILVGYAVERSDGKAVRRQWRLQRVVRRADGGADQVSDAAVGGEAAGWAGNSRPVLLIENEATDPAPGRIHFIGRGWTTKPDDNGCWYEAITIGDRSENGGWRLRRFYDEWTTTRSPVSAAFFGKELALAYRWFGNVHGDDDENLQVAFHGFGIRDEVMHDFDDLLEITEVGLERSIPYRHPSAK